MKTRLSDIPKVALHVSSRGGNGTWVFSIQSHPSFHYVPVLPLPQSSSDACRPGLKEQKRAFNAAFYEIFRYFASDGKKGQLCFMVLS